MKRITKANQILVISGDQETVEDDELDMNNSIDLITSYEVESDSSDSDTDCCPIQYFDTSDLMIQSSDETKCSIRIDPNLSVN